MTRSVDEVGMEFPVTDENRESTGKRAWPSGARLERVRVLPETPDALAQSTAAPVTVAVAYRLRNHLQRELGQLRRLLDGADLSDPALRRKVRLRVAAMVEACMDGERDFEEKKST